MGLSWKLGEQVAEVDPEAVHARSVTRLGGGGVRVEGHDGALRGAVWGEWVCLGGRTRRVVRAPPPAATLPPIVTPPMPAVVGRVLVAVGEPVCTGQGLLTVVAMKMELTLRAPHDGRVVAIAVKPGDNVQPGQILVEVAP